MGKSKIYAATKSAEERLAKGEYEEEYKKGRAKGCACGIPPAKKDSAACQAKPEAEKQ
jgi:hypothetical protein